VTTYTAIPNGDVDQDSPITQPLMQLMRDNPVSMFEGDPTAPKLQFAAMDTWFTTAGAVGTYVFAARGTGTADVAFGSTISGSSLVPTGAVYSIPGTISGAGITLNVGSALSGTWRCMGTYDHTATFGGGSSVLGGTLWMRIS
jgi:hypothetical protein